MPDLDVNVLYAAVGRALCAWETLEAHLSYLYSICIERPMQIEALQEYGRDARIFQKRMDALASAAAKYFQKHPSQVREGILDDLIADSRKLAEKRNQIAHGIVYSMTVFSRRAGGEDVLTPGYAMVPPSHGVFHLTKATGQYFYNSPAIIDYTKDFIDLARRVAEFTSTLNPDIKIEVKLC